MHNSWPLNPLLKSNQFILSGVFYENVCVCVYIYIYIYIERERQVYIIFPPSISLLTQIEAAVHTLPHLNHIFQKGANCKTVDM